MESFYGGKSGASFVIVKSFVTVAAMVTAFRQGPNYTDVHFNEYILIETENKMDADNGKIYRRGYDYLNSMGGAVYVGCIVGPAGYAPMVELTTIEVVRQKQGQSGYEDRYTEGEYTPTVNLVPGKDSNGNFNDSIKWACCSVRDTNGNDTTAYIGFKIPYTVIDIIGQSESAYYHRNNNTENFVNIDLVDRLDDGSHPFYQKWNINVPKGIKGDALKNFRVINSTNSIQPYNGQSDDVTNNRQILVYDYYCYDKSADGEPKTFYLGDYNMIKNITIDENGTISIDYTHNNRDVYSQLLKWIQSVELNRENGHFKVTYNTKDGQGNPTVYETDLSWVNSIEIQEDGKVIAGWSTGREEQLDAVLRWIQDVELANNGTVVVNYNNGQSDTFNEKLRWITQVTMAADGTVTIDYNNGQPTVYNKEIKWIDSVSLSDEGLFTMKFNNGDADYTKRLVWIKDVEIEDNGTITFSYNTGAPRTYRKYLKVIDHMNFNETANKFEVFYNTGESEIVDEVIKFIDKIYLADDETNPDSDFLFHVLYNDGSEETVSTNMVNYVREMAIDERDFHLLVYYSNPKIRAVLPVDKQRTYNSKDGWLDLGGIKSDSGILIGFNVTLTDTTEYDLTIIAEAIDYLNSILPNGITEGDNRGKIVTIGGADFNKTFYAYDYNDLSWYYLGTFDNDDIWTIVGRQSDPSIIAQKEKLAVGGVWFIIEENDNGY